MNGPARLRSDPAAALVAALLCASLLSCQGGSARRALLEHRAQHSVELLSWADRGDGALVISLRIQGPVHSTLEVLTVEVLGLDGTGETVMSEWVTLDISEMVRGTPFDKTVVLDAEGAVLEGLAVDLHPVPDADTQRRLEELEGISD
jgi:hypothetical protein